MKLSELGLKQKPQTKYFDGGFIAFAVRNGELQYKIIQVTKEGHADIESMEFIDREHFDKVIKIKTIEDYLISRVEQAW